MKHGIGYMGRFENNFKNLEPGVSKYQRADGTFGEVHKCPRKVDGIFFGHMECSGKRFYCVRVQYHTMDFCMKNPILIDPARHTDGKGFGPSPSYLSDDAARKLLKDMIHANPEQAQKLTAILVELGLDG